MNWKEKISLHLHKIHLWADVMIGTLVLVSFFLPETWQVMVSFDLIFHIVILGSVVVVLGAEKFLHKGEKGVVGR